MILWCAIVALVVMVSGLCIWNILLYSKQRDMQFELDKFQIWKQRVEVATSMLNTDFLEVIDTAHKEKWTFTHVFDEVAEIMKRWAQRCIALKKEEE